MNGGVATALLAALLAMPAEGQTYRWRTLAGSTGGVGFADGMAGADAKFNGLRGVAAGPDGTIYLTEETNHTVRQVAPDGTVTTLAGLGGIPGSRDNLGGLSRFRGPTGLVRGPDGALYVADTGNNAIRKVLPDGSVDTMAQPLIPGTGVTFSGPTALCLTVDGDLLVADTGNHLIRRIAPDGTVATAAGGGAVTFNLPKGVASAPDGTIYVADSGNRVVRKVAPDGTITTLAGTIGAAGSVDGTGAAARFSSPEGMVLGPDGILYVADGTSRVLRAIVPETAAVTTLAGKAGALGSADGTGANARFTRLYGMGAHPEGGLLVTDAGRRLRRVTAAGAVTTLWTGTTAISGTADGAGAAARFNGPEEAAIGPDGCLYVADLMNSAIRRVTPDGVVATFAGTAGKGGFADGPASVARLGGIAGLAFDGDGNLHLADYVSSLRCYVIRRVAADGTVATYAGMPDTMRLEDRFVFAVGGMARDRSGSMLLAQISGVTEIFANGTIRRDVGPQPTVTFIPPNGEPMWGYFGGSQNGAGLQATFWQIGGIAADRSGGYFLAEAGNHDIRRVTPDRIVSTYAGGDSPTPGTTDGTGRVARFNTPKGVAAGADDTLFVADSGNHLIRKVLPGGTVITIGGIAGYAGSGDGDGDRALFSNPSGIAVDAAGNVYVIDTGNHRIVKGEPLPAADLFLEAPDGRRMAIGDALDFGHTGAAGAAQVLRLRNTGHAPLTVYHMEVVSRTRDVFHLDGPSFPLVIPAGAMVEVVVVFTPPAHRAYGAEIELRCDAPATPRMGVVLSGVANGPPVFQAQVISALAGRPLDVAVAKLLRHASDPDGDPLAVVGVEAWAGSASSVTLAGDHVRFTPPATTPQGAVGFTVVVRDPFGAEVQGKVTVGLTASNVDENARNPGKVSFPGDGTARVEFHGIPGRIYKIQRASDFTKGWTVIATVTADEVGRIVYVDPSPPRPNGFYRLAEAP